MLHITMSAEQTAAYYADEQAADKIRRELVAQALEMSAANGGKMVEICDADDIVIEAVNA